MCLVSIIVPVYNVEGVLNYCIDSILCQTYQNFELLLINDGSEDGSGSICDQYAVKDSRIKVIHQSNCGVSKARNNGIKAAKGKWICFVDSDDFVEPLYIESLLKLKSSYPECDNAWCGYNIVNAYITPKYLQRIVFSNLQSHIVLSTTEIMNLHDKWLDSGPFCKLYDRNVIQKNSLCFPEELSLGEDLLFNFLYLDKTNGKIAILNTPLYNYVKVDNDSLTNKFQQNLFEKYKIVNKTMYECLEKWNCNNEQFIQYYNSCFYIYEYILKNTFKPESNIKNKYWYNHKIMKSTEFRISLKNSTCFIHPLYRIGYKIASYRFIRLLDAFIKQKNK